MFSKIYYRLLLLQYCIFFHVKEAASKLKLYLSLRKHKSTEQLPMCLVPVPSLLKPREPLGVHCLN